MSTKPVSNPTTTSTTLTIERAPKPRRFVATRVLSAEAQIRQSTAALTQRLNMFEVYLAVKGWR